MESQDFLFIAALISTRCAYIKAKVFVSKALCLLYVSLLFISLRLHFPLLNNISWKERVKGIFTYSNEVVAMAAPLQRCMLVSPMLLYASFHTAHRRWWCFDSLCTITPLGVHYYSYIKILKEETIMDNNPTRGK